MAWYFHSVFCMVFSQTKFLDLNTLSHNHTILTLPTQGGKVFENLVEKEKILVTSIFSFAHNKGLIAYFGAVMEIRNAIALLHGLKYFCKVLQIWSTDGLQTTSMHMCFTLFYILPDYNLRIKLSWLQMGCGWNNWTCLIMYKTSIFSLF